MLKEVCQKIIGRENEILLVISALQSGRHLFLEGPPGTSKSTILLTIAECSGAHVSLITGNSDLTTSKLVGYFDPAETIKRGYLPEHFNPGPLVQAMRDGSYLYVEEFNRLPDETTNVFITVMSENKLTVPRLGLIECHDNFRIIAALNPLDDIGISRISRALQDRFCSLKMDYQTRKEEIDIVKHHVSGASDDMIELAVDLARMTRRHSDIKLGASVRASIDMVRIYTAIRDILDREGVSSEERGVLNSALMAFRNKIWVYETSERSADDIIEELFDQLRQSEKKKNLQIAS
ncbi:MoxR family ATPase [candidate division KSB1 bacterium]|nr:MoxR family ATPase [candidate division KSB1 bacterium]